MNIERGWTSGLMKVSRLFPRTPHCSWKIAAEPHAIQQNVFQTEGGPALPLRQRSTSSNIRYCEQVEAALCDGHRAYTYEEQALVIKSMASKVLRDTELKCITLQSPRLRTRLYHMLTGYNESFRQMLSVSHSSESCRRPMQKGGCHGKTTIGLQLRLCACLALMYVYTAQPTHLSKFCTSS